jgi:hypothetical protein
MLKRSISISIIASVIEHSNAELSFLDLKGIDALVDHPGASPLYGYVALKTFLPNRRFFGNYGPGERRGLCGTRGELAVGLRDRNDCPLDDNSELVQRLFPSPDGINFVANQVPSDIVTRLKPMAIGKILERLSLVKDEDWEYDTKMKELESDLTDILFEQINEKRFVQWKYTVLQTKAGKLAKKNNLIKFLTTDEVTFEQISHLVDAVVGSIDTVFFTNSLNELADNLTAAPRGVVDEVRKQMRLKLHNMSKTLRSIEERLDAVIGSNHYSIIKAQAAVDDKTLKDFDLLKSLKRRRNALESERSSSDNGQLGNFEELANLIVRAVRESRRGPSVANGESYPKYMPEHALLAFVIQKANSKHDLVDLFDGMGSLVKDSGWFNENTRESVVDEFINLRWSPSDLDYHFTLSENPRHEIFEHEWDEQFLEEFAQWSGEKIMFHLISIEQGSSNLPRPISYGEARMISGERYPDCGETSLRNFFNNMLYDLKTSSFNTDLLGEIEEADPEIEFDPAIGQFYRKFPTVSSALTSDARNEWGQTIVAYRDGGIVYKKPGYEIRSLGNPDNMLNLIGQLLFQDSSIRERRWTSQSREEKLNTLCLIFSTDARQITWEYSQRKAKDSKGVKIKFKFNGDQAFTYLFDEGHFAISATTGGIDEETWRGHFTKNKLLPTSRDNRKFLVPLFVDLYYYDTIERQFASDPSFRVNLFYAMDLSDLTSQIRAFKESIRRMKDGLRELSHVAKRIRSKLPEDTDMYTARSIESFLYRFGYPLGIPAHTRNRPDAIYRPVSEGELIQRFGTAVAKKMGATFGRNLFGKTELLITDVLKIENRGTLRLKNQNEAIQKCLELNPPENRRRVESEIKAREEALVRFHWNNGDYIHIDCSVDGPMANIMNKYPISGFHSLSMDEFGCIFVDMGSTDPVASDRNLREMIPQILPNLDEVTWTSETPAFAGPEGISIKYTLGAEHAVRCGIELV